MKDVYETIDILRNNGVAIIPTDTLYGIVGNAFNQETVERIYRLRKRDLNKPLIILIKDITDIHKFDIRLKDTDAHVLNKLWPNKISVVLECPSSDFTYLHRGTNSLAFRIPNNEILLHIISKTGPLVAPSANSQGEPPATTIQEARKYFSNNVDSYLDGGILSSKPSTVVSLRNGEVRIIRKGAVIL